MSHSERSEQSGKSSQVPQHKDPPGQSMDSGQPTTQDYGPEGVRDTLPTVQVSFHLSAEEASSRLTLQEVREELREYAQSVTRVDASLVTLKHQMMTMRDQDLQLLKQLIQVGDTIRRMSRYHDHRRTSGHKRNSRRSTQELMTSAVDLSVTLRRNKGGRRSGSIFSASPGDYSTVPLLRRQSEPVQVCTLSPGPADFSADDLRIWGSRRGSGSSTDWWSEDTMGSSEDGLDTLGSDDDQLNSKEHRGPSITTDVASSVPVTTTAAITDVSSTTSTATIADSPPSSLTDYTYNASIDTDSETFVQRPKSHSVVATTYLNQPKLSGVNSAYSDILNKNVRLWKDRLEHAHSVRQKIAILEEESHES